MANRVVLGALPGGGLGLRVSRPGKNVLDTGLAPKDLAFDSRWPAAMRLVKSGAATTSSTPGAGATIMFGRTLPVEPMCFVVTKNNDFYSSDRVSEFPLIEIRKDRLIVTALPTNHTFSYYVFTQ